MLYATTRSDFNTYPDRRALWESTAPDGGLYVPMQQVKMAPEAINMLSRLSNCAIIAALMNKFFSCSLTERDVEFVLGKNFAQTGFFSHRVTAGECWHNPDGSFSRVTRMLAQRIGADSMGSKAGDWMEVAARTAMLFCFYARMVEDGRLRPGDPTDVSVLTANGWWPAAAWYARNMGLPIGNIICCANENGTCWELFMRGEMKTRQIVYRTNTPKCDVTRPRGLEWLIRESVGVGEVRRYVRVCEKGGVYTMNPEAHRALRKGLYAAITSGSRLDGIIANAYATNGYVLCPYTALTYAGLMSYRASTGSNGPALMICEDSPLLQEKTVARAMGITPQQLRSRLDVM